MKSQDFSETHSNTPSPPPLGSVARHSRVLPLNSHSYGRRRNTYPTHVQCYSFNSSSSFFLPSVINNFGGCTAPRIVTSSQKFRLIVFVWKVLISTIHNWYLAVAQNLEYSLPISTTMWGQVVSMGEHLSTAQAVPVRSDWKFSSQVATPFDCASSFAGPHLFDWTNSATRRTRFDKLLCKHFFT